MPETDGFIKIDGREAVYIAEFSQEWVDDSFSHEYGVRKIGHLEPYDIKVWHLSYLDDEEKIEVTDAIIKEIGEQIQRRIN